ncbi:MAG: sec-independent protein translocase protein TatD DNase family protein [Parcubacteria group bacterium]|nr:sec-independent protein translocase protein TatD DNase family protein [Parcubacteria group bacterium]
MKYIDIHSHLNFGDYEKDWDEIIGRLKETETGTIIVGTDLESSRKAVEIAEKHENIWACIGVHPVDDPTRVFEKEKFEALMQSKKVVAIGECGLDYFHADKNDAVEIERQKKLFIDQIEFAIERDLPIMIHSRSAYPELLLILEEQKGIHGEKLRGDVHFFAGSLEEAKHFINLGFTLSFTGVITFARTYDDVVKSVPLSMIMSETDAPFVTPAPYRGKRNEPSYVVEVVKKIAEIRGEDLDVVQKALLSNAERVFRVNLASRP